MVKPCLGADHTKESLSFEKQPSFFKGRNQSWFHPLRTPSRPGAAAPGPHGGSEPSLVLSHTLYRPRRTDRQLLGVETLLASYDFLRTGRGFFHQGGSDSSMEIPRLALLARDDRSGKAPRPRGFTGSLPSCYAATPWNPGDSPYLSSRRSRHRRRLEGSPTRNRCCLGR